MVKIVEITEEKLKYYERIDSMIKSLNPHVFENQMFICGASVEKNQAGLPNSISICPSYGSDLVYTYQRIEE